MALSKNVESIDKTIRLFAGILLIGFSFIGVDLGTTVGIISMIAGIVMISTGIVSFCPLFKIFGVSSSKN